MKNKVRQVVGVSNKLAMTQQIQLVIKLLQLNTVDLQREIDEKICRNWRWNFRTIYRQFVKKKS